jgi:hypothetical protein
MSLKFVRISALCGVLALVGASNAAWGQVLYGDPCCCPQPVQCQPCYQTIPVTEYRQCRQIVQRPVVQTTYVDQPVTQYRPVVENKVACVPTVSYRTVTECRTVQRDCGRWVTSYRCRPQMSPCQYDGRPDLLGFLNRTGYSLRMAFTPKVYAERTYVPNVITQQIPVTRQVAVNSTKTVNYQVTRMVPYTTTRRVAVNTVRMVAQEVVTQHPVTVFKTVPLGTGLAYAAPFGPTSTAALPPIPSPGVSTAIRPRVGALPPNAHPPRPINPERSAKLPPALDEAADVFDSDNSRGVRAKRSSYNSERAAESPAIEEERTAAPAERQVASVPSAIRAGRWVARKSRRSTGPEFPDTSVAVAGTSAGRR